MNALSSASRRVAAGIAVAAAAVLLPAMALAGAPGTAAGAASTAPRCGTAHPGLPGGAFVWSGNPGDGFAGGIGYEVEISNVGRHACTLRGVPGLAAVLGNGHQVGGKVPASGKGPLVTLKPRATAHFGLRIHDGGAICTHPLTVNVVVYLPGQKQGQPAYLTGEGCPGHPGGGILSATAIHAGTGIPAYDN
jgi:Protein of unknown function (DUF4232)